MHLERPQGSTGIAPSAIAPGVADGDPEPMTACRTTTSPAAAGIGLLMAMSPPVCAEDVGAALVRGFYDEASLTVHLRSYYMDRTNPVPPNNVAWAGGGWVG